MKPKAERTDQILINKCMEVRERWKGTSFLE